VARAAQAHAIGHQMLNRFHLHDLDGETNPFCSLAVAETVGGELAMARWIKRLLATAWAASGGAPSPGMALAAVAVAGGPSPCSNSTQKALE
jgi:hypothetical protein